MTQVLTPRGTEVDRKDLVAEAGRLLQDGWRLALTAAHEDPDGFRVVYVFLRPVGQRTELVISMSRDDAWMPSLASVSFSGGRFDREIRDLYGIRLHGHPLQHRLVRHGHWPTGWHPMLSDAGPAPAFEPDIGSYPFLEVVGTGVYEIPVGPIHAGLIEPGHFRFSVVGETIVRLKARLWFMHRGVEKLFEGKTPEEGIALAERISGDTSVGHTLAYVTAVEDAVGAPVSARTRRIRALLLELERLYNHVNDLGAIPNDVAFGIAYAQALRLRETLLRHNKEITGHRLLRGGLSIGGADVRRLPDLDLIRRVAAETAEIAGITAEHSIVHDRMIGTAVLDREQAESLGTLGYVARASGMPVDARRDHPWDNTETPFEPVVEEDGDVRARFLVRMREVAASADMIVDLTERLSADGPSDRKPAESAAGSEPAVASGVPAGLGVVEAWRGTLVHRVELGEEGQVSRLKAVDPSFFNWPALPVAVRGDTIVPDFPLVNKSFNQSYAGNDL